MNVHVCEFLFIECCLNHSCIVEHTGLLCFRLLCIDVDVCMCFVRACVGVARSLLNVTCLPSFVCGRVFGNSTSSIVVVVERAQTIAH